MFPTLFQMSGEVVINIKYYLISFAKSSFGTTWGVLGDLLGTIWTLLEDDLGTNWGLIGDFLRTTWGLIGD